MTRDDIAARVRFNLDDNGIKFYSADDLNDSIQDAYNEAAVLGRTIEKTATVSFVDNLTYYDLSDLISDYYHVIGIYNNNTKLWLDYIPFKVLQETDHRWEVRNGQPKFFTVIDDSYIAISPRLADATGTMLIMYKAQAATLSGATTPIIQTENQKSLEQYSTGDMLEQKEEFQKAERWMGEYYEEMRAIIKQVNGRNAVDRINILQDISHRAI